MCPCCSNQWNWIDIGTLRRDGGLELPLILALQHSCMVNAIEFESTCVDKYATANTIMAGYIMANRLKTKPDLMKCPPVCYRQQLNADWTTDSCQRARCVSNGPTNARSTPESAHDDHLLSYSRSTQASLCALEVATTAPALSAKQVGLPLKSIQTVSTQHLHDLLLA